MKQLLVLLTMINFGSVSFAEQLRSDALKRQICDYLESDFSRYGLNMRNCLAAHFDVEQFKSDTLRGRSQPTLMVVKLSTEAAKLTAMLKKLPSINNEGQITLSSNWHMAGVREELGSVTQIILRAKVGDDNVARLRQTRTLPKKVLDWTFACEMPDYDCNGYKYYKIVNPAQRTQVVGYLVEESAESHEAQRKVLSTARFNLEGDTVGDVDEESEPLD